MNPVPEKRKLLGWFSRGHPISHISLSTSKKSHGSGVLSASLWGVALLVGLKERPKGNQPRDCVPQKRQPLVEGQCFWGGACPDLPSVSALYESFAALVTSVSSTVNRAPARTTSPPPFPHPTPTSPKATLDLRMKVTLGKGGSRWAHLSAKPLVLKELACLKGCFNTT